MDARKQRMLSDLVRAAEEMAKALERFSADDGLIAFTHKGDGPIHEWVSNKEVHGYGWSFAREFRRLLEDARREGLVP